MVSTSDIGRPFTSRLYLLITIQFHILWFKAPTMKSRSDERIIVEIVVTTVLRVSPVLPILYISYVRTSILDSLEICRLAQASSNEISSG
jgi:hypothetical protein